MTEAKIIQILLADDQAMIRQGLRYILDAQSDMQVVADVSNGQAAVDIATAHHPDMVLMDIQMPIMNGIDATMHITRQLPDVKVLLLTTFDVQDYVVDGIRAGAVGYLLKDLDTEELLRSIRMASDGAAVYRSSTASRAIASAMEPGKSSGIAPDGVSDTDGASHALDDFYAEPLTDREVEVLQEMAYGKKNAEIAVTLSVSEGTVKTHVHRILQKLGVEDRTQAVVMAIRRHIVD